MDKKERNFLGIWVPRDVYLNKDLNWSEKILLVEIESLDNEKGCFASNDYFADFLDVTKTTISTSISKLKKLGFVEQVSFDGRTRVLKVNNAAFKKTQKQHSAKLKGSIETNLTHNKTNNNTSNKNKKINIKKEIEIDPSVAKKIQDLQNGNVCIEVDELKKQHTWIESVTRHLQCSMFWVNKLLNEFISEQQLKDDGFKSIKEQKTHFLNWAKIQIKNNRKTNQQWGRYDPQHHQPEPIKRKPEKTQSPLERRKAYLSFIDENLIQPYNEFVKTDKMPNINDFGSLISKELEKHGLLYNDKFEIEKQTVKKTTRKKGNLIGIGSVIETKKPNINIFILKRSFIEMKKNGVDLKKIIFKDNEK